MTNYKNEGINSKLNPTSSNSTHIIATQNGKPTKTQPKHIIHLCEHTSQNLRVFHIAGAK
jgi:hypothetical protein